MTDSAGGPRPDLRAGATWLLEHFHPEVALIVQVDDRVRERVGKVRTDADMPSMTLYAPVSALLDDDGRPMTQVDQRRVFARWNATLYRALAQHFGDPAPPDHLSEPLTPGT